MSSVLSWDELSGLDCKLIACHDEWEDKDGKTHNVDILSAHDKNSGRVYIIAEKHTSTLDHGAVAEEICSCVSLPPENYGPVINEILTRNYPARDGLVEVLDQLEAHSREQREKANDWRREYAGGVLFAVTKLRTALTSAPVAKEREAEIERLRTFIQYVLCSECWDSGNLEFTIELGIHERDGGSIQDKAEELGIIEERSAPQWFRDEWDCDTWYQCVWTPVEVRGKHGN